MRKSFQFQRKFYFTKSFKVCSEVYEENEETVAMGRKSVCVKTISPSKLNFCLKTKNPPISFSDRSINKTKPVINRFCGRNLGNEDSCRYYTRQFPNMTCLTCDTDLCNKSHSLIINIGLLMSSTFAVVFFCHF